MASEGRPRARNTRSTTLVVLLAPQPPRAGQPKHKAAPQQPSLLLSCPALLLVGPRRTQQYAKDLERERRAAKAATQRASGLEAEAAALRRNKHELAEKNAELLTQQLTLEETADKLRSEANELVLANRRLAAQVGARTPPTAGSRAHAARGPNAYLPGSEAR